MPVEEQLATIFEVIEGGVETTAEVIPFPADAGASALEGTTTAVQLGNGVATEVSQLTVVEGGANTTAGVGLLAMDVGAVGLAIAPALGILAGVGLYNLAPEFWTNVSNRLTEAGQTVGGKVRAFLNGDTKQAGFSKETIEIFKQAFIEAGLFDVETYSPTYPEAKIEYLGSFEPPVSSTPDAGITVDEYYNIHFLNAPSPAYATVRFLKLKNVIMYYRNMTSNKCVLIPELVIAKTYNELRYTYKEHTLYSGSGGGFVYRAFVTDNYEIIDKPSNFPPSGVLSAILYNDVTCWAFSSFFASVSSGLLIPNIGRGDEVNNILDNLGTIPSEYMQPDATPPTTDPFPTTYPTWTPWTLPEGLPDIYPVELPVVNPDATQETAQTPDEIPDNDSVLEWLLDNFPLPTPIIDPEPTPTPDPDPDPQPEPEPIPEPEPEETDPNPVDPNPTPTPSPLPIIPDLPDTVESNAMFTVYKPSMAQVNAFGGWLWSTNIVEQIKRIWQNPLDGIISFMKVYVDAPTSGSDTIKVGILDSEVSSPVVSGQFVTVECGSLNVREKFYNATDYSPFVSMHLYLPFIGIVELDIDEFMSGEIKVTYHVDVYTGTCLAEVKSRRSPDMPEWTIVYTFSGNASQQLPLTSAEFSGALSSLVGVVGGGLAVASGGGLGLLAGASGIAHAVSHEMVHLAHSGSLSANAGIMGARTPYLILTRRRSYDANGYSELYGYPSNKTVFLNNCSGYVKVKDIRLETVATDSERLEIENLLKAGVII